MMRTFRGGLNRPVWVSTMERPADTFDRAVHAQPAVAVTAMLPALPKYVALPLAGDIATLHDEVAAACVTVKVCPATVIVPVRELVLVLAATEYDTVPVPVWLAPAVIVIHAALLAAVQLHVEPAVTATLPLLPVEAAAAPVGDRL